MLLEVDNVCKSFGGLQALNRVSFGIRAGEVVGLIGPNGAGKTTLFSVLTGFERPDSGKVIFSEQDITGQPPYRICATGIARTFQLTRPFANMDVTDNVMVGALCRTKDLKAARAVTISILDETGLTDKGAVPAGKLTIADRKRLELARALATNPRLLLLDEVAAGLNEVELADLIKRLKHINQRGVTLFVVEHIMAAVMTVSSRIIVLEQGAKLAEGTPEQVARDPAVIEAYLGSDHIDA